MDGEVSGKWQQRGGWGRWYALVVGMETESIIFSIFFNKRFLKSLNQSGINPSISNGVVEILLGERSRSEIWRRKRERKKERI